MTGLNHFLQRHFRIEMLEFARDNRTRLVPKPKGPDEIVYGDKVMAVANRTSEAVYPSDGAMEFVANGEIGVVVGVCTTKWKKRPDLLEVEFSIAAGIRIQVLRQRVRWRRPLAAARVGLRHHRS